MSNNALLRSQVFAGDMTAVTAVIEKWYAQGDNADIPSDILDEAFDWQAADDQVKHHTIAERRAFSM